MSPSQAAAPAAVPAPISLTDDQMSAIMRAAGPLQAGDRGPFLEAIAAALQGEPHLGDGSLHRLVMSVQREFLRSRPVLDDHAPGRKLPGRYARRNEFTRSRRRSPAGSRAAAPR